jgi:hypothetical protein
MDNTRLAAHMRISRSSLMPAYFLAPSRVVSSVAGMLALAIASCAQLPPTAAVAVPPIPAGAARVWFNCDSGPYDGLGTPFLRMNGAIVGVSEPGGALYRDLAPGQYHVTVDNYLSDATQARDVYLFPGQQAYFKIVSLKNWIAGGNRFASDFHRDTFYVWQIAPEVAQGDVARSGFYGGS